MHLPRKSCVTNAQARKTRRLWPLAAGNLPDIREFAKAWRAKSPEPRPVLDWSDMSWTRGMGSVRCYAIWMAPAGWNSHRRNGCESLQGGCGDAGSRRATVNYTTRRLRDRTVKPILTRPLGQRFARRPRGADESTLVLNVQRRGFNSFEIPRTIPVRRSTPSRHPGSPC